MQVRVQVEEKCDGKMVPTYADNWEKSWLKKDGRLAGRDTFNLCMK